MKQMRFALVLLLTVFAVMLAGEASAYPNWIKLTGPANSELKLERSGNDINKGDYWVVRFPVTYRNTKDSGRIIIAIFDKTLSVTELRPTGYWTDGWGDRVERSVINSSIVNKVEVWPNSTKRLWYSIPLSQIMMPTSRITGSNSWKKINERVGVNFTFTYKSWSHDFQVRSEKM